MQLLVAMKEGETRIVRREIDIHRLIAAEHCDIFHDARRGFAGDVPKFERVPMQMHGMDVVAWVWSISSIAKYKS